jgi:hypothetical protein
VIRWRGMRLSLTIPMVLFAASAAFAEKPAPKGAKPAKPAPARPPKLAPGVWKPLLQPNQKWVLKNGDEKDPAQIIVETYDVRKVGDADVARLRWTHTWEKEHSVVEQGAPTQIALGKGGVWFLSAEADDKAVAAALKKKADYADPPQLWKEMSRRDGRAVTQEQGNGGKWMICIEDGPPKGAGECEDVCFASFCFADEGIVKLDGTWSPSYVPYSADGWGD